MRPTPAEVIDGVRRILKDVIEPELGSEYARSRLREVRAVLAQVDWNDAAATVFTEQERYAAALATAGEWAAAAPGRAPLLEVLAPVDAVRGLAFDDVVAARDGAAARLVDFLRGLDGWAGEHPEDPVTDLRAGLAAELLS